MDKMLCGKVGMYHLLLVILLAVPFMVKCASLQPTLNAADEGFTVSLTAGGSSRSNNNNNSNSVSNSNNNCCQNGGTCVLGSFCHCPDHFYGRFCEFEMRSRNCGPLKHMDLFQDDCNSCRCVDGVMMCQPHLAEEGRNCDGMVKEDDTGNRRPQVFLFGDRGDNQTVAPENTLPPRLMAALSNSSTISAVYTWTLLVLYTVAHTVSSLTS